ncbi:MAG: ATP-binding protein [Pyrinomonadaceae bacterium]
MDYSNIKLSFQFGHIMKSASKQSYAKPYMWLTAIAGAFVCLFAAYNLPVTQLDGRFLIIAVTTVGIGSRLVIGIPGSTSQFTFSDTFVFLTILMFGGEAAILLAVVETFFVTIRISKKPITILFNVGQMACATFLTVSALHFCYGNITGLSHNEYSGGFVVALCMMAFVQFVVNSGASALQIALKTAQPLWQTWKTNYLWTSITYVVGAFAAGIIAKMIGEVGFYAFLATTPIIAIVYLTYQTYHKNVEAAAQHAAQAERHVEELSRYIAEQERIREQFSQIEKLSALGELASGVAHDFNNTLAGILGRAQLMMRTNDPEKIKRGLNLIIQSAEDGAKIVKRIQDFARQRRDHDFAPLAVDQLLYDVGEMTRPRWKDRAEAANIQIDLKLDIDSHAMIMGDASELREVLINIVFNAVDAMPAGGTLTLAAREVEGSVEISVGDTGVGMSAEVRSRIFDPFFTTKGKAGLGLGLAVSYGIISRHEGSVEAESEPGCGTTFRIKLPIAKGIMTNKPAPVESEESSQVIALNLAERLVTAGAPLTTTTTTTAPTYPVRIKILVVDDELNVRELLGDILESKDCEAVLAGSGQEALQIFDQMNFDGIFTDVGMPGMSGWEFARAIRKRNASIPIAVITGWGEAVGSIEQEAAQVEWIVTKPFSADRISELVKEISARRGDSGAVLPFPASELIVQRANQLHSESPAAMSFH